MFGFWKSSFDNTQFTSNLSEEKWKNIVALDGLKNFNLKLKIICIQDKKNAFQSSKKKKLLWYFQLLCIELKFIKREPPFRTSLHYFNSLYFNVCRRFALSNGNESEKYFFKIPWCTHYADGDDGVLLTLSFVVICFCVEKKSPGKQDIF